MPRIKLVYAFTLGLVTLLASSAALGPQAHAQEQVQIDARGPVTPFPHFWEQMFGSGRAILSLRESYRDDLRAVKQVADFRYVRFHAILHDEVGVYNEDEHGNPVYNFSYVDQIYDGLLKNGVRPVVEISFMPKKLAANPDALHAFWYKPNVSPPKSIERWDGLMTHFAQHLVERYGIDEVAQWYFEVWNEPKATAVAGSAALRGQSVSAQPAPFLAQADSPADYSLTIATKPIELAPKKIVSVTTYNGQFPGPLLRFKEGQHVTIDVRNDTDIPEQLHWHGQAIPSDVDGAAEEGTPFIPPHQSRRISFVPKPSGFRFYHTHIRAGSDLSRGQYSGLVGPVFIEPKENPGKYDREVFLTMKEFEPTFSRGGDMDMHFLLPASTVKRLKDAGEGAMKASLAKGMQKGYEVGYGAFTINGRMLGHGEPVRVKQSERVLFHILNGSAGEIRSLALPGHTFLIVAMDGNPLPSPVRVPGLWIGTAERISAIVEMNHPGVWIMGDVGDDDRHHGMGIVVEYVGYGSKPLWIAPKPFHWNYASFGLPNPPAQQPDEVFKMTFAKDNAALEGFNRWTINGVAYPSDQMIAAPLFHLREGKRYRIRMRNESDDIHPIHLHRHTFELTKITEQPTSGVRKDVLMVGGYHEVDVDFTADNPGPTLFHCHQQLHMDYGFMALFDYV